MDLQADLFADIVVIFVAAFLGGTAARLLRLPTLLGYMSVGLLVGPHALGLISNVEVVRTLAELGVVLLLFAVGVEISMAELRNMGRRIVAIGLGQLGGTLAIGYGVGVVFGWDTGQAVVFGMVLALSSTMVVLKTLSDRGELLTLSGRVTTGVLLLQDIAFVPMIAVLPALSGGGDPILSKLGIAALKAAVVFGLVLVLGGKLIPWMLRRAALLGSRESFIVTVVAVTLTAAALTSVVGLSAALGAFAAGLVMSTSDWTGRRALQEVIPIRDVFAALFFASLGMLTDPAFLLDEAPLVVAVIATSVIVKFALVALLARGVGYLPHTALLSGGSVVQIGEFSFILAASAEALGIVDTDFLPLTVMAAVATMAMTPGVVAAVHAALTRVERRLPSFAAPNDPEGLARMPSPGAHGLRGHVVIAGLGRVGSLIAKELERQAIWFVAIDMDPDAVQRTPYRYGFLLHGDAARQFMLEAAGVPVARLLVVSMSDPIAGLVTVQHARRISKSIHIVGRVGWPEEAQAFQQEGANAVVWPEMEAALEIMRVSLIDMGVGEERVEERMAEARQSLEYGGAERAIDRLANEERRGAADATDP
jgi:CPA2 family monovalent cation:H+ antiporter-2